MRDLAEIRRETVRTIKNEFEKRARTNSRYSLRRFAKYLDVDHSLLAKVLKGEREPSHAFIQKMNERLYMPKVNTNEAKDSIYNELYEDHLRVLSDWYHFALLEYIKARKGKLTSRSVANEFNLTEPEISLALERLQRLGYITRTKNNHWRLLRPSNTWHSSTETNSARMRLQRNLLEKALAALDEIPFERRDHSSITMACDPKLVPEIREKIKQFRRELDQFIEERGSGSEIYNLSLAFFPLTKEG